jgi:hypothetical protein
MRRQRGLLATLMIACAAGVAALAAGQPAKVHVAEAADKVDFHVGDELVARYYTSPADSTVAKPYIWPLNGSGGVPLTRAWPMEEAAPGGSTDHPHQKSAWFCHGDVIPEGLTLNQHIKGVEGVDFWSEAKGHGRIVGKSVKVNAANRVTAQNEWLTADGQKVLGETRTIELHNFGATRLLVFDIMLTASAVPVTFGDTKEGSFGIRIHDALREVKGQGKLENADGKVGEKNCWGHVSSWCDYSGPIGDTVVGLAILDDPKNPYPACWHSRGYGLMAANPFGRARSGFPAMKARTDLVHLARGEELKLRYGLLVHPGDAKDGKVAEFYERFVKLRR